MRRVIVIFGLFGLVRFLGGAAMTYGGITIAAQDMYR